MLPADLTTLVKPGRRVAVPRDAPDSRIPERAVAGKAELIVTGDQALLAHGRFEGVRVVRLADCLGMD